MKLNCTYNLPIFVTKKVVMNISFAKSILLYITILLFPIDNFSQTIIRQSVGTMGTSFTSQTISVQQSIGQPYQTNQSNATNVNQGFIQPINTELPVINSTFNTTIGAFPNPTKNNISFLLSEEVSNVSLVVYSILGKVIISREIELLNGYKLDCNFLKSGNYFIKIIDKYGNTYQSRFSKI